MGVSYSFHPLCKTFVENNRKYNPIEGGGNINKKTSNTGVGEK